MYAITGITGQVGGAVAENLFARGKQVRARARNVASDADRGVYIEPRIIR